MKLAEEPVHGDIHPASFPSLLVAQCRPDPQIPEEQMKAPKIIKKCGLFIIAAVLTFLVFSGAFLIYNQIHFTSRLKKSYIQNRIQITTLPESGYVYIDRQITEKIDPASFNIGFLSNQCFTGLLYKKPMKIVICRNERESRNIFKLFTTKSSGFAFSDNLIIINYENALALGYSIDSIILHESSHILFKQNIQSWYQKMWTFSNRSLWFSEGLAVSNQGYISYSLIELEKALSGTRLVYRKSGNNFRTEPNNKRSDYSVYYYYLEYLIQKYGEEKLRQFIQLMSEHFNYPDRNYRRVFEAGFFDDLNDFSENILHIPLE